jgi:hypothetical protein
LAAQGASLPKSRFNRELDEETNRAGIGTVGLSTSSSTNQVPPVEQAIETTGLMLGTDKSRRGYCLEMICADFLAGANLENDDSTVLLQSISRFFKFLPGDQRQAFLHEVAEKAL